MEQKEVNSDNKIVKTVEERIKKYFHHENIKLNKIYLEGNQPFGAEWVTPDGVNHFTSGWATADKVLIVKSK